MRDASLRAGGTNTNATNYATKALALQKMRLADTLNAGRTAQDYNKNVDYQRGLASAPLAEVSGESPYYGTATSGQDASLHDLTQFGLASYGPWNALIQGSLQGAGAGAGAAVGCWIAEAIYGTNDWRTATLRAWLNGNFKQSLLGRMVMAFYLRFGQKIAACVQRSPLLRKLLKPTFDRGLRKALRENLNG